MDLPWLKLALACVDSAMAGVAWLILLCTYPDFARWRAEGFAAAHEAYTRNVGWVVGPLLLAQLIGHGLGGWQTGEFFGVGLVACTWGLTGFWSVPCHRQLQRQGPTSPALGSLLRSHAWRTALWSALAGYSVWRAAG
ncbi:MAG: hypothetical protein RLZ70_748 [Verrucomicrobiota bacterium]|jgi:hypothetical protein